MAHCSPFNRSIHSISLYRVSIFVLCFAVLASLSTRRAAALDLTPATANAGWKLTAFASGFPVKDKTTIGPLGIAFTNEGKVLVADYHGEVFVFPNDNDGHTIADAVIGQTYLPGNAVGLARVGANYYMTTQSDNHVVQINADGTFNKTIATLSFPTGICANPNNGHLFVTYKYGVADVNPLTGAASKFLGIGYCDGIATDGITLYVALGQHIVGYRLSDKVKVFDSGYILAADGVAIGSGTLAGQLFVNTNYGQVFQIDIASQVITLIATGGSRGDFIAVDPNGSLLITATSGVWRLTPPAGSSFVTAGISVSPTSVAGGLTAAGKVTLNIAAPIDLTVGLVSGNAAASVPASVTVPAGSRFASFPITTTAVSASVTGGITASLNSLNSSADITVRPIGVKSFVLKPTTIKGGTSVQGVITLEGIAAPGDIVVTFTSSDTATVLTPISITIKAGVQAKTITIPVKAVTAQTVVTLAAVANSVAKTANLTVTP